MRSKLLQLILVDARIAKISRVRLTIIIISFPHPSPSCNWDERGAYAEPAWQCESGEGGSGEVLHGSGFVLLLLLYGLALLLERKILPSFVT